LLCFNDNDNDNDKVIIPINIEKSPLLDDSSSDLASNSLKIN